MGKYGVMVIYGENKGAMKENNEDFFRKMQEVVGEDLNILIMVDQIFEYNGNTKQKVI